MTRKTRSAPRSATKPTGKSRPPRKERVGAWLVGAHGGLSTTLIVGARMIAHGLVSDSGLLTETDDFADLKLLPVANIVFGGHDVRNASLYESAREIYRETGTIDIEKLQVIKDDLRAIDEEIKVGTTVNCGAAIRKLATGPAHKTSLRLRDILAQIEADITNFKERNNLDQVIVVNLASTEPPLNPDPGHETVAGFQRLIDQNQRTKIRASALYAWAAVSTGCPFINFTPNDAAMLPAIQKRARSHKVPLAGSDGKTGETLVKSALAPMFKYRNLQVMTWQGYNILGDRDGQVLSDARNKKTKIKSKDSVLSSILGYPLHTHVGIDYVPSLNDLKTAWDFIHFRGFLDFKMSMQFTWQGCDAILAAPVVLDMIRLAALGRNCGETGLMTQLSCFFKNPVGVNEHDLHFQFHHLMDYVETHRQGGEWKSGLVAKRGEVKLPRKHR